MKKLFIILLFTSQLFATNWYCDGALTGTDNGGTSWADAWESFAEINWASIVAGDYLYISGGSDSLVYNESLDIIQEYATKANRITIIAGKYSPSPSGHSGRVIIDGEEGTRDNSIYLNGASYLTIKGFECRGGTAGVECEGDYNIDDIILDSLVIYDFLDQAGIFLNGEQTGGNAYNVDSVQIKNCSITTPLMVAGQTDNFYAQGAGNILIDNCFFRNRNQDPLAHNDALQGYHIRGILIKNCILINDSVNSPEGGGMPIILGAEGSSSYAIMYNNFCYMGGAWYEGASQGWGLLTRYYSTVSNQPSTHLLHNTVVINGNNVRGLGYEEYVGTNYSTINNIVAMWCPVAYRSLGGGWMASYDCGGLNSMGSYPKVDSCRSNLFWRQDSVNISFSGTWSGSSGNFSPSGWSNWVANGGTGLFRDPLFVSDIGNEPDQGLITGEIKSNSPAIDAGEDLEDYINWINDKWNFEGDWALEWSDINGVARDNTPAMGAYEYDAGSTDTTATFYIAPVTGAALNSYHIGSAVLSGADSTFHVWTETSDSFKIGALSSFDIIMDSAHTGDTIFIPNVASGTNSTLTRKTVVVSGSPRNYDVTTLAASDTVPAAFTFLDYGYANLSTALTSYPFKLTSFDSCNAYFEGENFAIYRSGSWGSPSATMRKVYSTDSIRVTLTSSGSYSTPVSAEFIAGGVSDVWYVTTKGDGQGADSLGVQNVEGETQEALHTPAKTIDGKGALDGDLDSRWAASPMPKTLIFDLGQTATIVKTRMSFYNWNASRIYQYYIDVSDDYTNWYRSVPQKAYTSSEYSLDSLSVGLEARYVKVTFVSNNQSTWAGLWEGKIYGAGAVEAPVDTVPSVFFVDVNNAGFGERYETSGVFTNADSTFWVTAGVDSFHIGSLTDFKVGWDTAHVTDTVYVVNYSSIDYDDEEVLTLTAGGTNFYWSITTKSSIIVSASGNWWTQPDGKMMIDKNGRRIRNRIIQ